MRKLLKYNQIEDNLFYFIIILSLFLVLLSFIKSFQTDYEFHNIIQENKQLMLEYEKYDCGNGSGIYFEDDFMIINWTKFNHCSVL